MGFFPLFKFCELHNGSINEWEKVYGILIRSSGPLSKKYHSRHISLSDLIRAHIFGDETSK